MIDFDELMTTSEIVPEYWRLGQGDFADCILDSEGDWLIVYKACDIGHAKALMAIVEEWKQLKAEKALRESERYQEFERERAEIKKRHENTRKRLEY